jgi:hypothetical protein
MSEYYDNLEHAFENLGYFIKTYKRLHTPVNIGTVLISSHRNKWRTFII